MRDYISQVRKITHSFNWYKWLHFAKKWIYDKNYLTFHALNMYTKDITVADLKKHCQEQYESKINFHTENYQRHGQKHLRHKVRLSKISRTEKAFIFTGFAWAWFFSILIHHLYLSKSTPLTKQRLLFLQNRLSPMSTTVFCQAPFREISPNVVHSTVNV